MQWKIDTEGKGLELGGHYWIDFDRLTDADMRLTDADI